MMNVKNILKSYTSLVCSIVLSGCLLSSCHFLEVEKVGKSDIEGYFCEITALEPAIFGVLNLSYSVMDKYMYIYPGLVSDELQMTPGNPSWEPYYNFTRTSSEDATMIGIFWKNAYNVINNCNQIISHAPALAQSYPMHKAMADRVSAQAYYIRALMHFCLVNCYAQNYSYTTDASHLGVPVVDHVLGLNEKIGRAKVSNVYSQIISDLQTAVSMFPADYTPTQFFPSALAAKALLARVYLYKNDWVNAEKMASEVIAAKPLVSRANYKSMFTKSASVSDDECIFRLNGFGQSNSTSSFFHYQNPSARPSSSVISLFENGDIRQDMLYYKEGDAICMKHVCTDVVSNSENLYLNHIVSRVSEMYLIRAEALNEMGKTSEALNDIRILEARALGINVSEVSLQNLSVSELIETERVKELCFEGHRFFDLARRHKDIVRPSDSNSSVAEINYPDYRYALPFPQVELSANEFIVNNPMSND